MSMSLSHIEVMMVAKAVLLRQLIPHVLGLVGVLSEWRMNLG